MLDTDWETVLTIAGVAVALVAIATTGATITSVATPDGDSGKIHVDMGGGGGDPLTNRTGGESPGEVGEGNGTAGQGGVTLQYCVEPLATPLGIGGVVAVNVVVLAGIYRRFNAATTLFTSFAIVPVVIGTWAFLTNCVSGRRTTGVSGASLVANGDRGVVSSPPVPPSVMALGFGGLVVVALATMVALALRGEESFEPVADEDAADPDEAAFARAAGRAADRIEEANVAVDNAVYEAWLEMTALLDMPEPETAAPMDFADEAIEFGLDENDVYRLTELFNEVRYGHKRPDEREERAVETLRHIESAYEESLREDADANGGDS